MRVYAFGDVHGRADLLEEMLAGIAEDEAPGSTRKILVGLGDYIDRGPESRSVLDLLVRGIPGVQLIALRGNHEQMLLDFLERPNEEGPRWLSNGGLDTILSYQVDGPVSGSNLRAMRDRLASRLPVAHLLFLQSTKLSYICGDYLFAHAGVRLDKPAAAQGARDLLWIRQGFSDRDAPFEKVVVHGHTTVDQPYLGSYRIALDTGAYSSGVLTCIALEGADRRLLTFSRP